LGGYKGFPRRIFFSLDGTSIVAATGDLECRKTQLNIWLDSRKSGPDHVWESQSGGHFLATTLSPDGTLLAINRDQVEIYEFPSLRLVAKLPITLGIRAVACFSRDGQVLAVAGDDGIIRLFRPRSGILLKTIVGDGHAVLSLAFSPDGSRLAAGLDGPARVDLWHVPSGKRLTPLAMPTDLLSVPSLSFSPDCRTLGAAGSSASYLGSVFLFPLGPIDKLGKKGEPEVGEQGSAAAK
jgi:WD40 repeat protein